MTPRVIGGWPRVMTCPSGSGWALRTPACQVGPSIYACLRGRPREPSPGDLHQSGRASARCQGAACPSPWGWCSGRGSFPVVPPPHVGSDSWVSWCVEGPPIGRAHGHPSSLSSLTGAECWTSPQSQRWPAEARRQARWAPPQGLGPLLLLQARSHAASPKSRAPCQSLTVQGAGGGGGSAGSRGFWKRTNKCPQRGGARESWGRRDR